MRALENRKLDKHNSSPFFEPKIQKKLKTGTAGDRFEIEADKTADKVVHHNSAKGGLLQSKEELQQKPISETISSVQAKDMKEEKEPVQKKSDKKEEEKPVQKKEKEEDKAVQKKSDKKEEEKPVQKKEKEEDKTVQKKSDKKEEEKPVQKKEKEEDKAVQKKSDKKEEDKAIQAKCDACEKEDKVQKKEQNSESEIQNNELEGKLNNSKGGGEGLDQKTKREMESGFGNDFSNVKIHTDTNAVQMSQELGAQAFTNGNDVYFNKGKYSPDSKEGKHLLAHELTHTIQQTGMVQKSSLENHPEDLQAEKPQNPQFKGNSTLESANDNELLITTGHKGSYVKEIQSGLLELGHPLPKFGADGDFGTETRNAVLDFQSQQQLNAIDGIVGPETIGELDNALVELKGDGKKGGCKDDVPFVRGPFTSQESVGFFSTAQCPNVDITIEVTAQLVESHFCSTLEISIDHVKRTRRTVKVDHNGKGSFSESFTLKNHKEIHNLFFNMPEDCKGMGDTFSVKGNIKRH
ncbi:DUF4157 domain-containing protein [Flavobacterium sp. MC2016-06]|jgi:hypothetical protein|uniref:eCIS core domain-containing protein n=1 Tax=Flavobacterium sp. MC2016-06 TaxID=2676308 RepID=UPI0012BA91EF|nr:DUF4157 domain-containing protein [Flavobacterium sp. MC2016-06]MBU3857616.1 DUF4157 domain-containing protein [Flavobacterium sp. MC2016-06]